MIVCIGMAPDGSSTFSGHTASRRGCRREVVEHGRQIKPAAGGAADLLDHRFGWLLGGSWFLSHRLVLRGYDEPKTPPFLNSPDLSHDR